MDNKAMRKCLEAYLRVVCHGGRGCEQDQGRFLTGYAVRLFDQAFTDPLVLISLVYSEVGQVTAKRKVGQGPGNTDKFFSIPSGHQHVTMRKHFCDPCLIVY